MHGCRSVCLSRMAQFKRWVCYPLELFVTSAKDFPLFWLPAEASLGGKRAHYSGHARSTIFPAMVPDLLIVAVS